MKRVSTLSLVVSVVLLLAAVEGRSQEARRPKAPALTSDDVVSQAPARAIAEESVTRPGPSGAPLRNARTVLESALTKMAEVNSVRIRMQASLPTGEREVLIESVKPDRAHITSPEGEMIIIGRKFYLKSGGTWQVTSAPSGGAQSDAGFDIRTVVKEAIGKAGVSITGQILGDQTVDGVNTVAYEFAVNDRSETGKIQVSVGKDDGYIRRMLLSSGGFGIKVWFSNINEQFSIEPPR
jgi:hypothetical protein